MNVQIVDSFPYLGSQIHSSGSSDTEISRRIIIVRACMRSLDRGIWHSGISVTTKFGCITHFIPVLLYGCEAWSTTGAHLKRLFSNLIFLYLLGVAVSLNSMKWKNVLILKI
ncbi:hypothetical protein HELRODRAFT_165866 [Helobdella robusta]|uniref:Uncharacterized protein n=1 Tax=Helobdella robusta TaxID=6412 RepID=T1EXD6_HELRO|nr:hypothetical protein HELRODRAFT_165866 [Helobdella robusta]ESN91787.1 hypothetical protein HELRODRAFT_165866 [Helobdella robusta]